MARLSEHERHGNSPPSMRDRIGRGPWQNAKGVVVAQNVDDLHSDNNKLGKENSLTEKGGTDGPYDKRTGSGPDGSALPSSPEPVSMSCGPTVPPFSVSEFSLPSLLLSL